MGCSLFSKKKSVYFGLMAGFLTLGMESSLGLELNNNNIHQDYVSPRALGMGNAFTAVADDFHTLFYNPAGLAHLEEWKLNILMAQAGISVGDSSFTNLYDDLAATDKKTGDEKTLAIAAAIEKQYGKNFYGRVSALNTIWTKQNWGIGFIPVDVTLNLGVNKNIGPTLNISAYQDSTLAFGYGRKLHSFAKGLSGGVTLKTIYRARFESSVPASELAENSKYLRSSDAKEGMTLDADVGFLYQPFEGRAYEPTFGFVVRNIGDYGFFKNMHLIDDASGKAPKLQRRVDVGSRLSFQRFFGFKPTVSFDIRDMGHDNWSLRKGLHLGSELQWGWRWLNGGIRAGMNQGYYTMGLSLKGLWFLLEAVTYGEEIGTKNAKKENRVNMARVSLDF